MPPRKLTKTQREAIAHLIDGEWRAFGSGFGSYRVALRALHHRLPGLVEYEARDGDEFFHLTAAGLQEAGR